MTSPLPAWRDHITGTVWFLGGMLITSVVIGAVVLATHSSDSPALAVHRPGDPAHVEMVRCPAASSPETLISAAACGRIDALGELLEHGAEVGQTDPRAEFRGRTALHHAVQRGDEAAVQLLLEAGAATDARDAHGNTPLHLLALATDVAHPLYVARFLIDAGADIEVRNVAGHTPLETLEADHLRMIEQQDLAQMLLRTVNAADDEENAAPQAMRLAQVDETPTATKDTTPDIRPTPEETPQSPANPPLSASPATASPASGDSPQAEALELVPIATDPPTRQDVPATVLSAESAPESAPAGGEVLASTETPIATPAADGLPELPPSPEHDIRLRLDAWAKAWSDKQMDAYFDVYAPTFEPPGGLTMDMWRAQRDVRITGKAETIEVTLSDVTIEHQGERASVDFTQHYRAGRYTEVSHKRLDMTLHEGRWCIVAEREIG